jgi:class 3 adenylate cyclase/CHASE2 domain-containing sensor protein
MERALSAWDMARVAAVAVLAVVAAVEVLPPLAAAARFTEDWAVARLAPARPQHSRVVIVAITEDTLARLPYRSPLDRGLLAGLVRDLRAKGAAAIGLDVLFDQPSEPDKDRALHAELAAPGAPAVVLAAGGPAELTPRQRAFHTQFLAGLLPGHGHLARDRLDGAVRRQVPWLDGRLSLPTVLAATVGVVPASLSPQRIDWLRPPEGMTAFAIYPAEAVAVLPPSWLAGKLVLIGQMVPDADRHRTPLSLGRPPMAGVEIQAQILAQMLDGRRSPVVGAVGGGGVALAAAALGALAAGLGLSMAGAAVVAALGAAALWGLWAGLAAAGGPIVAPLAPSLAWLAALGGGLALARVREHAARVALMDLFAAHLSAPVAEEIWRHRHELLAGGRLKPANLVATVLFSDVENFTPASETLGPERLMDWIEAYLEAMTDIVTGHGGVVLRFLGDGILAAFGVPLPCRDEDAVAADAGRAVRAALAMEAALLRLNADFAARGLPEIRIRIGMVTGPMVGGSVGARRHLEYTLMGDAVNTAARLEALAKTVTAVPGSPCRILAAASTWQRVAGLVAGRRVGAVAVKGKVQPVEVYQVLGAAQPVRPDPPVAPAAPSRPR